MMQKSGGMWRLSMSGTLMPNGSAKEQGAIDISVVSNRAAVLRQAVELEPGIPYRRGHSERNRFLDRILDPILGPYPWLDFSSQRLQARELPTTH